jgi:GAF domain-containing protein
LPLTDQEGTLGVLALYFSDHRQLTEPRIKLLTTLASAAAPAIRSANAPTAIRVLEGQGPDDELKQAA